MEHLTTGRSGLRTGRGSGGSGPSRHTHAHPQPTLNKDCLRKHGLPKEWVELPELRGDAAAQVVVVKVPARGAPEQEIMWERRQNAEGGKCDVRASPARRRPPPPPTPYSATAWRRGCQAAVAHRTNSAVSSPICEGRLPPRSLFRRFLREGRRSGRSWGNGDRRRRRQVRRACFP